MTLRDPQITPIVLRLHKEDVAAIDSVASAMNLTRSSYLRRSIRLAVCYSVEHELPVVMNPEVQAVLNPNLTGASK